MSLLQQVAPCPFVPRGPPVYAVLEGAPWIRATDPDPTPLREASEVSFDGQAPDGPRRESRRPLSPRDSEASHRDSRLDEGPADRRPDLRRERGCRPDAEA